MPALARELWIVTHQDLRRTARVRVFLNAVTERIGAERMLIEENARHPLPTDPASWDHAA